MSRKNIYFNQETESLLVDLSKKLDKSMSDVISITLNKYRDDMESRAMTEFRLCYDQLSKSIEYLQACRDYGTNAENAQPWTNEDNEILELLNKAHDPLMYYNNDLIYKNHPDWFDQDGEILP